MTGKWLGFLTRTYEQFVQSMRDNLPSDLPEITDFSQNNPFIFRLNVWGNILEALQYNIDRKARNNFLQVTTVWQAAYYIAKRKDYRIKGATPATVDLAFTIDDNNNVPSDLLIPQGTQVSTRSGILFFTTEDATITAGTNGVQVSAQQAELQAPIVIGTTDGNPNQQLIINDVNVVDNLVLVTVDGVPYSAVDTFAYSMPTDLNYRFEKNVNELFAVEFGDGTNGIIPASGLDVSVTYRTTQGFDGRVGVNEIVNIDDNIVVPGGFTLSVNNPNAATGGTNADDLQTVKSKAPKHRVTLERAVTEEDYQNIAVLVAGIESAGIIARECHKNELYVSPIGGGIASQVLRQSVSDFFADKKMIGQKLDVYSAGILELDIRMDITVSSGFLREQAKQNVRDALEAYASSSENKVGDSVAVGDIYEVIEGVEGVENSELRRFTTIPYAFPIGQDNQLNWSRTVQESASEYQLWEIRVQSATVYEIFKDGGFVGLGNFGDTKEFDEIVFNISTGGYTIGDKWQFNIYPYNRSIASQEASRLSITASNVQFDNVVGGV